MRLDIEDYKTLRRPVCDPVAPEAIRRGCPEQNEDSWVLSGLGWPSELTMYIGAIDGRVKEIGNTHFKPLPSEMYLNNALTQLRKKKPINKPSTVAKGCFIEYNKNP
jgi:hypothetical protein